MKKKKQVIAYLDKLRRDEDSPMSEKNKACLVGMISVLEWVLEDDDEGGE